VVHRGDRSGFTLESPPAIWIARHIVLQDLQRDFPPELHVLREKHFAHAAAAKAVKHPVVVQCLSDGDRLCGSTDNRRTEIVITCISGQQ